MLNIPQKVDLRETDSQSSQLVCLRVVSFSGGMKSISSSYLGLWLDDCQYRT